MTLRRLSDATLGDAPADVLRPAYDRAAARIGVVHFGPGAFHRAHQAFYLDRMLAARSDLAISAISLRSDDLRAALTPQDGLYSLLEREAEPAIRVIGAIGEVLTAPRDPAAVFARLADPAVRYVTITVTEKGYHLATDGELDLADPEIQADLAQPDLPRTLVGWLVEGLRRRRAAGAGALTVLSCDNLSNNGSLLGGSACAFARARHEFDLAAWIMGEVRFPGTMVDSITPATDEGLRAEAAARLGLTDAWPIQRERFVQWVIEDSLPGADHGLFAEAGVTVARDVEAYEQAKLRLLNGAHSTLAYAGLLLGHATVAEAMADRRLAGFVETLMRRDIAPTLGAPTLGVPTLGALDLDVPGYIDAVLRRFANPAIEHRLAQIAWDGSQKLPIRLLAPIELALVRGADVSRLVVGVAAWMAFIRRQARAGVEIVDPLAVELARLGRAATGDAARDVAAFLGLRAVFPESLAHDQRLVQALAAAYAGLGSDPRYDSLAT